MKTHSLKMTFVLFVILTSTLRVDGAVDFVAQENRLTSILTAEKNGQFFPAALDAIRASEELLNEAKVGEIVITVDSSLKEIRKEIIIEKRTQGASTNILFSLFTASFSSSRDISKIITTNPEEVAQFSRKVSDDFKVLQHRLFSYIESNEMTLAYAKAYTLKAVQMALAMHREERRSLMSQIKRNVQLTQTLQFFGAHFISKCLSTDYTRIESSDSLSIGGLFARIGLDQSVERQPYNLTTCNSTAKIDRQTESILVSAKLGKLDLLISHSMKQLGLTEVLEVDSTKPITWGLY